MDIKDEIKEGNDYFKTLKDKIINKTAVISILGLGYVGLPLAVAAAKAGYNVIGIDTDIKKVEMVNKTKSYIKSVSNNELLQVVIKDKLIASSNYNYVSQADCVIIAVPTPIDQYNQPNLNFIKYSVEQVETFLRSGMLVILESTTYPGTTEELVKPILESKGLKCGNDFFLSFSPERVDPGNKEFNIFNTSKVVGGVTSNCTEITELMYTKILGCKTIRVSKPIIGEMGKILENTFRYVNIALINEMSLLCEKMGIDIWEVIETAKTKPYGFLDFYPGPGIGGHCIPIDPHYLCWKAKEYNFYPKLIETSNQINNYMPEYIVYRAIKILNENNKSINKSKILILGVAYKKNIDDLRESPALKIIEYLEKENAEIYYNDPYISNFFYNNKEYKSIELTKTSLKSFDLIIIVTDHSNYDYQDLVNNSNAVFDTRNATNKVDFNKNKIFKL